MGLQIKLIHTLLTKIFGQNSWSRYALFYLPYSADRQSRVGGYITFLVMISILADRCYKEYLPTKKDVHIPFTVRTVFGRIKWVSGLLLTTLIGISTYLLVN